jgi:hypothetical protein
MCDLRVFGSSILTARPSQFTAWRGFVSSSKTASSLTRPSIRVGVQGRNSTKQSRKGFSPGKTSHGEDATDGDRRTIGRETRRVSNTKQGHKNTGMIFRAKLDGLATLNTVGSGRDVWEAWYREPLGARGRDRCRALMTLEKTTVLCL